ASSRASSDVSASSAAAARLRRLESSPPAAASPPQSRQRRDIVNDGQLIGSVERLRAAELSAIDARPPLGRPPMLPPVRSRIPAPAKACIRQNMPVLSILRQA